MQDNTNDPIKLTENKKIEKWREERNKPKNKNKIDILPKPILLKLYNNFCSDIKEFYSIELEYGSYIGRITNFPSHISENIVLYILRFLGILCTWACTGDIMLTETKTPGEVKCHYGGPTQFSPNKKKEGHTLFYLEAEGHIYNGDFKLYKIENYNEDLKNVKINKNSLLEEQQDSGRRPRFTFKDVWNLEDKLIWEGNIYELLK